MNKRDIVAEILSKKSRLHSDRWKQVSVRLTDLRTAMELIKQLFPSEILSEEIEPFRGSDYELLRYFPIALVACIEGYFRLVYADLINRGSPFRDNASKFDIKFTMDTALSLQRNSVSLGEFAAHLLPLNNLDDINGTMSKLIGDDFLECFKKTQTTMLWQQTLFDNFDESTRIISGVKEIFEFRHIYCHELSPYMKSDDRATIRECYRAATEFLWISEALVKQLLL